MPTASILTKTSDQTVSSGSTTTVDVTWQTETKYLDADFDFFDAGTSTRNLNIPTSMDGILYEVFLWVEDDVNDWGAGSGGYFGLLSSGLASTTFDDWGIMQDIGRPAFGTRSGIVPADASGADWYTQAREFQADTMSFKSSKCRFGVLAGNPVPRAMASGRTVGYSTPTSLTAMALTEDVDFGDIYNPATGVYTAPASATLAIVNCSGYVTSGTSTSDVQYVLEIEGVEKARFRHDGSLRGFGPGTFGMIAVSGGDEVVVKMIDAGGVRTGNFAHSVEFY